MVALGVRAPVYGAPVAYSLQDTCKATLLAGKPAANSGSYNQGERRTS